MIKILTVVGARPQFIKAAVVGRALAAKANVKELLLHTGQHFDANMSNVFFSEMEIQKPAFHFDIHGGSHGAMTALMLTKIEEVLIFEKPNWVLVYGDTNSTLAGALAAAKLNVPVAHVEAGLRSFNSAMPEEINRVLTDHMSTLLLPPTETAKTQLLKEGLGQKKIHVVGDVMFDASLFYAAKADKQNSIKVHDHILVTIHRQENTDNVARLKVIVEALNKLSDSHKVVWPIHPRTRATLKILQSEVQLSARVHLMNPVGYLEMIALEKNAKVIFTDSGGVQKEAFFCKVPCVTVRDETEWAELVSSGWNRLAPPLNAGYLIESVLAAIGTQGKDIKPYGDGHAGEHIADLLVQYS